MPAPVTPNDSIVLSQGLGYVDLPRTRALLWDVYHWQTATRVPWMMGRAIAENPDAFLASTVDREAAGEPIVFPDGSSVPRLPGYRMWMWDGEFCGSTSFRWHPGTEALPPYCLGHIGYSVVPWKRGRGYATQALGELLDHARAEGLRYAEIATRPDNVPSQRVILANGGVLVEEFTAPAALGGHRHLRYRVRLVPNR